MDVEKQRKIILEYLEDAYIGARKFDDMDTMLRLARAIVAFKSDLTEDIFTEEVKEKYYAQD